MPSKGGLDGDEVRQTARDMNHALRDIRGAVSKALFVAALRELTSKAEKASRIVDELWEAKRR